MAAVKIHTFRGRRALRRRDGARGMVGCGEGARKGGRGGAKINGIKW